MIGVSSIRPVRRLSQATLALILLRILSPAVFAADPKNEIEKSELNALRGAWRIMVVEVEGRDRSDHIGADDAFIFADDHFVLRQTKKAPAFKFKLDPAATPKTIDFLHEESGDAAQGIYELSKDDLKICYGQKRPAEFATAPGQKALSFRLKRIKETDAATLKRFKDELAAGTQAMAKIRVAEAIKGLENALALAREYYGDEHAETANVMLKLALIYRDTEQYAKAEPLYSKSLPIVIRAAGPDAKLVDEISSNIANVCDAIGQFERAEKFYKSGLEQAEKKNGVRALEAVPALVDYANFHLRCGRVAEAERLLQRARRIVEAKRGPDDPALAIVLHSLGRIYRRVGNIDEAERLYRTSLKMLEEGNANPSSIMSVRHDLAMLLAGIGQYEKSRELLEAVLKFKLKANPLIPAPAELAELRLDLATVLQALGKEEDAVKLMGDSLQQIRASVGDGSPSFANALFNQGYLRIQQGRFEEARDCFIHGRKIVENALGVLHPSQAHYFWGMGNLLAIGGDYTAAEGAYALGLVFLDSTPDGKGQPQYGRFMREHALIAALSGKLEAPQLLVKALEAEQDYLRRVFSFSSESAMHDYLAMLDRDLRFVAALALRDGEGSLSSDLALTWVMRRKTIVLDELMRNREVLRLLATDPEVEKLVARRNSQELRLQNTVLRPGIDPKEIPAQLAALSKEKDEIEAQLNRRLSKGAAASTAQADAQTVQAALPEGSALVEFLAVAPFDLTAKSYGAIFGPKRRYLAFVLRRDQGPPKLFDLGDAAAIDALVQQLRDDLEKTKTLYKNRFLKEADQENNFKAIARELHDLVFAKLKPALGESKLIYLAGDGPLNTLPFETLVDADGQYLLESRRFAYLASGHELLRPKPPPARGVTVFAGPNYQLSGTNRLAMLKEMKSLAPNPLPELVASHDSVRGTRGGLWGDLAGAAAEAKVVREALAGPAFAPQVVYAGDQALEEVFKGQAAPRVLHLATHGFYYPPPDVEDKKRFVPIGGFAGLQGRLRRLDNPLWRSGLVLAGANVVEKGNLPVDDGWLTAAEIALLDFRGTDLVVLSACQTGLGDIRAGEGVSGMRRAFQHAGARTVMTTLFEIPDQETAALMREFYSRLAKRQGKLAALQEAKLEIIKARRNNGAAHPFFWSGFVLAGDPE